MMINHVPIPMRDVNIIVGMDWLEQFEAMVDCKRNIVRV